jgi:hypothetical protein
MAGSGHYGLGFRSGHQEILHAQAEMVSARMPSATITRVDGTAGDKSNFSSHE